MNFLLKYKTVANGRIAKKIFCLILFVLFILSVRVSNARALAGSQSTWVAQESYGPLEGIANFTLNKKPVCVAVNEVTNRIYVGVEDGLIIIDGETDEVIVEIPLDTEIRGLAVNPQTNRIYAGGYPKFVAVINGATNQKIGEIPQGGINKYEIAVNPVTNLVYIADTTMTMGEYDCVRVYHGETLTLIDTVNIPGSNESTTVQRVGVTVNPATNRIYATWRGNGTLYVIDGNTHEIMKTVKPSFYSDTVTVNPYTNYVYIGGMVLDGETLGEVVSYYQGTLEAVNPIRNILYTRDLLDTLYALNGSTHGIIDSLELPWYISSSMFFDPIAVNSQTSKIYILDNQENQVLVVIPEFHVWTPLLLLVLLLAGFLTIYNRRLRSRKCI